jgi:hypothetical protein
LKRNFLLWILLQPVGAAIIAMNNLFLVHVKQKHDGKGHLQYHPKELQPQLL